MDSGPLAARVTVETRPVCLWCDLGDRCGLVTCAHRVSRLREMKMVGAGRRTRTWRPGDLRSDATTAPGRARETRRWKTPFALRCARRARHECVGEARADAVSLEEKNERAHEKDVTRNDDDDEDICKTETWQKKERVIMRSRCVITNVLFRASTHLRVLTGVCWSPLWHAGGRFSGHPFRFLQTTARATCFCFYLFMHIQICEKRKRDGRQRKVRVKDRPEGEASSGRVRGVLVVLPLPNSKENQKILIPFPPCPR